jgi:hypothetical protein
MAHFERAASAKNSPRWRPRVIVAAGIIAITLAGIGESARSCTRRGGVPQRFNTLCSVAELTTRSAVPGERALTFDPSLPAPGSVITATYTPTLPEMQTQSRVVLRGRTLTGEGMLISGQAKAEVLGVLDGVGSGRFVGSFRLPPGVTYARMAIESAEGNIIDANNASLFELMTGDSNGLPLYESLIARALDHLVSDPAVLVETGRLLQRANPARPWGAYVRLAGESVLDDPAREAEYAARSARLYRRFDERLRHSSNVSAADMELMRNWARSDFDNAGQEYWSERAVVEHPRSPVGTYVRSVRATGASAEDSGMQLDKLEAIWQDFPSPDNAVTGVGVVSARRLGDAQLLATWLGRFESRNPTGRVRFDERVAAEPEFLDLMISRLRAYADTLTAGNAIPVVPGETRQENRRQELRALSSALASLTRVLIANGRAAEALRMLAEASDSVLEAETLVARSAAHKAIGDRSRAIADLASAAAIDEGHDQNYADSARAMLGAAFDNHEWDRRVGEARDEYRSELLSRPIGQAVGTWRVRTSAGADQRLNDAATGQPLVVAIIRTNTLTGGAMGAVDAVAHGLADAGVRWIYLDAEVPGAGATRSAEPWHEHASVYYDVTGELLSALAPRFVPQYYVIDAAGRVRFTTRDLREVHTFAMALAGR